MWLRSPLSWILVLLLAADLFSCKAPTAPAPNPTLTLILPDSARAFDTLTFRAHYSDPVLSSWKFAWQFGDSAKAISSESIIKHVYDSAGTYTLRLALKDSISKTISTQSGQLQVLPFNGPKLTLVVPDTVYWGDSAMMSVSSLQPLKPGWAFIWSLGDSTIPCNGDSVLHYFLTPGNFSARVSLLDTIHHILIASQNAMVHVIARHFDLALLQSMTYVDCIDNGQYNPPIGYLSCGSTDPTRTIVWKTFSFTIDTSYSYNDTLGSGNYGYVNAGSGNAFSLAQADSQATMISYRRGSSSSSSSSRNDGGFWSRSTCSSGFGVYNVPFIRESDSEVLFQSTGKLINASFSFSSSWSARAQRDQKISGSESWLSPYSRITIRFHK